MDIFNFVFTLLLIISLFIISFGLIKINKKQQETEELLEKSIKKLEQDLANEKFKKRMLIYKNKLINKENSEEYDIYFNFKRKGIAPEQFYKNRLNNKSLAKHHMLPKIKLLLDKGYNLPEIAKMLDISNGELKIIMDFGIE